MPRIEVQPGQLTAAGGRQAAISASMIEAVARLETAAAAAASAAGDPGVAGAVSDWSVGWGSSLAALATAVAGTAGNLDSAAGAYELTDATAIAR